MHYYVDGYNLMFRLLGGGDDFTNKRQQLIRHLSHLVKELELDVTLVFDSQYQLSDSSRAYLDQLEILFSAHGETADELIIKEIKEGRKPKHQVVVTSDKKLAWFARRCAAKTETVEEFISLLRRRYKNKQRQKVQILPVQVPLPPPKRIAKAGRTAEDSFDYYLEQFQKRLESEPIVQPRKHLKSRKKSSTPLMQEDPLLSEAERWLRLFEQRLQSEEQS